MIGEILKYTIPSIILLAAFIVLLRFWVKHNQQQFNYLNEEQDLQRLKLELAQKGNNTKTTLPMRLQAYERVVLFLERINPPNLIKRSLKGGQTVAQLQLALLSNIREEYEHNMSQQLYLGDQSWELVKAAKEEVIRLINTAASGLKSDDESALLAKALLSTGFDQKKDPVEIALMQIKKEVKNLF